MKKKIGNKAVIRHEGIIDSIDGNRARIAIARSTACDTCETSSSCKLHGKKIMYVEVVDEIIAHRSVGDTVNVEFSAKMGHQAVFIGFGLPLILFVAVVMFLHKWNISDCVSAIVALGSLFAYYLLLYFVRELIGKRFKIHIVE